MPVRSILPISYQNGDALVEHTVQLANMRVLVLSKTPAMDMEPVMLVYMGMGLAVVTTITSGTIAQDYAIVTSQTQVLN